MGAAQGRGGAAQPWTAGHPSGNPNGHCVPLAPQARAAGRAEVLSHKLLLSCVQLICSKPVLPAYGDVPVCLLDVLVDCAPLAELATRSSK